MEGDYSINCERNRSRSRSRSDSKKLSVDQSKYQEQIMQQYNSVNNRHNDYYRQYNQSYFYQNPSIKYYMNPYINCQMPNYRYQKTGFNEEKKVPESIKSYNQFYQMPQPIDNMINQCVQPYKTQENDKQMQSEQLKELKEAVLSSQQMITISSSESSMENKNQIIIQESQPKIEQNMQSNIRMDRKIKHYHQKKYQKKDQTQQSQQMIDLTIEDYVQSFYGLSHPMLLSSNNYDKKEIFDLVQPFEYQCGNFILDLGYDSQYMAIVTLQSLYQQSKVYYLFMVFQLQQQTLYCLVPEDDQTTLLVSSNLSVLHQFCQLKIQDKDKHKSIPVENNIMYKFPNIFPNLILKEFLNKKKYNHQIQHTINFDNSSTKSAIEDLYQDLPGYLIIGANHPYLRFLIVNNTNRTIPEFYLKFFKEPLQEGQYSFKVTIQQNGNILIERRFLSPFSNGIHLVTIQINRVSQLILIRSGDGKEIHKKSLRDFWEEIYKKYMEIYPSKLIYNYFKELIKYDKKIQQQFQQWNILYDKMYKQQMNPSFIVEYGQNNTIIINDKKICCNSQEEQRINNNKKNKYL